MDYSTITINPSLPIAAYEDEIIQKFENSSNMIIIGETGSGKTTQIPLMLLKSLRKVQEISRVKIVVTEPRRLAATSVSKYISELIGDDLGKSIGYKIRFNELTSKDSKVIFMTDGILLREAQLDPLLLDYSVVMVDEAHERNINSDFLVGLLVDIQKKRKEGGVIPLKIIVTSATLEKDKFEGFFRKINGEDLAIIEVPGRLFPVTTHFEKKEVWNYEYRAAELVKEICLKNAQSSRKGDILIFMPGKHEIEKTKIAIEQLRDFEKLNLEIITVHANLPIEEQNKIFAVTEKRKVVIATNIAETSLTVPGVVYVIDSGLIKQMEFNPHTGLNSLITQKHARKGLEQRKGRAGRIEPGEYYALYTEASYRERPEFQVPEILRTSLAQVVLIMKNIGITDIENFHFISSPYTQLIHNAINELKQYGALDQFENITAKGKTMAQLPLEPKLANLIIEADKNKCIDSICTICAFLELKPLILNLTYDDFVKLLTEEWEKASQVDKGNVLDLISEEERKEISLHLQEERPDIQVVESQGLIHQEETLQPNPNDTVFFNYDDIPVIAKREFYKYDRITKGLLYHGSDFLTILKIWKMWINQDFNSFWVQKNYLSLEVLEEAKKIREELLEIVQKAGYQQTDMKGRDLEVRIEKTLINAFKYNILVRQKSGFYKRIRSEQSGIKLHNTSVLREEKPYYCLAYEIIEIAEIDSEPKLSAKILHTLNTEVLQRVFPKDFKKERNKSRREERRFGKKKFKFRKKDRWKRYH